MRAPRASSPSRVISLLVLTGSMVASHAASVVVPRSDLPTAIALPLRGGEIVGDDPAVLLSRAAPPQERAPSHPPNIDIAMIEDNALVTRAAVANDIPTAFDTSVSTNFTTASCPAFFDEFLSDSTYVNCYAISFLLRNSNSFFTILRSAPATSHILDLSCAADLSKCSKKMSDFASKLRKDDVCGEDYDLGNPIVNDAYTNFITYEPIARATCLKNPVTNDYCFVDAVTNTTNAADYDVYAVAYGSSLTSAPYPTCNQCLDATMGVFSDWAQVRGQPLVDSYLPSARGVNSKCGDGFANVNITVGAQKSISGAGMAMPNGPILSSILVVSMGATLLGLF